MNPAWFFIGSAVALVAKRALLASRRPKYDMEIGPIEVIRTPYASYEVALGPAEIYADSPPPAPALAAHPMTVAFFLTVSGLEKLSVDASDVEEAVLDHANALPGIGRPIVSVSEGGPGYYVKARYLDSSAAVSPYRVKQLIESMDSRLQGRVSGVSVKRA